MAIAVCLDWRMKLRPLHGVGRLLLRGVGRLLLRGVGRLLQRGRARSSGVPALSPRVGRLGRLAPPWRSHTCARCAGRLGHPFKPGTTERGHHTVTPKGATRRHVSRTSASVGTVTGRSISRNARPQLPHPPRPLRPWSYGVLIAYLWSSNAAPIWRPYTGLQKTGSALI